MAERLSCELSDVPHSRKCTSKASKLNEICHSSQSGIRVIHHAAVASEGTETKIVSYDDRIRKARNTICQQCCCLAFRYNPVVTGGRRLVQDAPRLSKTGQNKQLIWDLLAESWCLW